LRSEIQLAELAGCEMTFDPLMRQWRPVADTLGRSSHSDVYLAGDGARICGADGAEITGSLAASASTSLLTQVQYLQFLHFKYDNNRR